MFTLSKPFSRGLIAAFAILKSSARSLCTEREANRGNYFDSQGFSHRFSPSIPLVPEVPVLHLAGVGNIGRPGLLEDLPNANVAIALPPESVKSAKRWLSLLSTENVDLATYLLSQQSSLSKEEKDVPTLYRSANPLKVAVMVKILEHCGSKSFVRLFRGSLTDCSEVTLEAFIETLSDVIGSNNLSAGDSIEFYWFENGDLVISKGHDIRAVVHIAELNRPLLESFIGKRSITPNLANTLEKNISTVVLDEKASITGNK